MVKKCIYLCLISIKSQKNFKLYVFSRVVNEPAVEHFLMVLVQIIAKCVLESCFEVIKVLGCVRNFDNHI